MPLTDEQRTKAVQWFAGKLGRCPMCGNQQWPSLTSSRCRSSTRALV